MDLTLIPIGYGNAVVSQRIVAIIAPDSSPVKRLREEALSAGKLVDATHGRRTRAIIITDSDHVILSALHPETISMRFGSGDGNPGLTREPVAPQAPAAPERPLAPKKK